MKHRVGHGRAVSGDHLERLRGAEPVLDADEQVEQIGIDRLDFVGAEIAQDIVDAIEFAGNVLAVLPVSRVQALAVWSA